MNALDRRFAFRSAYAKLPGMTATSNTDSARVRSADLGLAVLLEQVCRNVYPERGPNVIQPAQWPYLRYFDRAGEANSTVSGIATFFGITKGPASRAVAALERRGLLTSMPNPDDGRSQIYALSQKGRNALEQDPLRRLAAAISSLPPIDQKVFQKSIFAIADELNEEDR